MPLGWGWTSHVQGLAVVGGRRGSPAAQEAGGLVKIMMAVGALAQCWHLEGSCSLFSICC